MGFSSKLIAIKLITIWVGTYVICESDCNQLRAKLYDSIIHTQIFLASCHVHNGTRKICYPAHEHMKKRRFVHNNYQKM